MTPHPVSTVEFWQHSKICAARDDAHAMQIVARSSELAKQGYCVDRAGAVHAEKIGQCWKYTIPVIRVAASPDSLVA